MCKTCTLLPSDIRSFEPFLFLQRLTPAVRLNDPEFPDRSVWAASSFGRDISDRMAIPSGMNAVNAFLDV
jgi:hypothetical protein